MPGMAPTAAVGRVQVTVPAAWLQDHPVPVAETNVVPAGRVSVKVTLDAACGPALLQAMLYVIGAPAATGSVASVLLQSMSASGGSTTVSSLQSGSAGVGSFVFEPMTQVFVTVPPVTGALATI